MVAFYVVYLLMWIDLLLFCLVEVMEAEDKFVLFGYADVSLGAKFLDILREVEQRPVTGVCPGQYPTGNFYYISQTNYSKVYS